MKKLSLLAFVVTTFLTGAACALDRGETLGMQIASAAKRLQASKASESTVSFKPKEPGGDYSLGFARTQYCPSPPCESKYPLCAKNDFTSTSLPYICSLTLSGRSQSGKNFGGTDWSLRRYVGVPRTLFVEKRAGQVTLILLRKGDGHIDVVDLK